MKTISTYVAAAALAVGTIGFTGCDKDSGTTTTTTTHTTSSSNTPDNRTAGEKVSDATSNAADKVGDAAKTAGSKIKSGVNKVEETVANKGQDNGVAIRTVIGEVVNASLKQGAFNDVHERFVDADHKRLQDAKLSSDDQKTLDGRIADINKSWQSKYGHEFKITNENDLYGTAFMTLVTDDPKNPSDAKPASADVPASENGRKVGSATIAASHGLPEVKIPLVQQAGGWKLDVPDTAGTPELYNNLMTHLTHVGEMKDKWPDDEKEAYRIVTHHVLAGVMRVQGEAAK